MNFWYQNLAKEDQKRWPHFRGHVARDWSSRYKFRYEVCTGLRDIGLSIECFGGDTRGNFQISLHLLFVSVWITIESLLGCFPKDKHGNYRNPMRSGFRFDRHGFYVQLWDNTFEYASDGSTYLINWHYNWPWTFAGASVWQVRNVNGDFVDIVHGDYPDRGKEFEWPYRDRRKMYAAPYRYILQSGEQQNVVATFYVDRMVWFKRYQNWPGFSWAKWPKIDRKSISISFSGEVGERAGSWKGGTIGCGYEMREGELPIDTLRRMELERKFR